MIPIAQACLLSAFVSVIVGVLVYGQNPTHVVSRTFLMVCVLVFYFDFTEFEFLQAGDASSAFQWVRLAAFWYLLPVTVFLLCTVYANLRLGRLALYSMYGLAVFFSVLEALVAPYQLFKMSWGWGYRYTGYFGYVQVLWVVVPTIAALPVLIRRYSIVKSQKEKTGVAYVLSGVLIPIVTGIFVTLLPFVTSVDVPDLTAPAVAVGFLIVGYGVLKHGNYMLTASVPAQDVIRTMSDALFIVNTDIEIVQTNESACRLVKYGNLDLVGQKLSLLTQDSNILQTLHQDSPSTFDSNFKMRNGESIPVFVSRSAITAKDGSIMGQALISRDISDRKRLEEELREARKLATIGETTTMVGHDLRNPLQAMTAAVYLMKRRVTSEKAEDRMEAVELLSMLDKNIRYMDKIVSDLQDYARPIGPELVETDLPALITGTVSNVKIPGNVQVTVAVNDGSSNLKLDPALFTRVLTNLILNAVQAMPEGGKLTITGSSEDGSVTVTVQDTGLGITQDNLGKIFNPFFTTKAQGQGLGLSVCKRIIEAQGGIVNVTSQVGKGSTFTFKIPTNGKLLT